MSRHIPHGNSPLSDVTQIRSDRLDAIRAGASLASRGRCYLSFTSRHRIDANPTRAGHLLMHWHLAYTLPGLRFDLAVPGAPSLPLPRADSGASASFLETSVGSVVLVLVQHLRHPSTATTKRAQDATEVISDAAHTAVTGTKRPVTTATRYSTPSGAALCAAFCACAARARAQRHRGQQSLATRLGRQRANICLWTTSCDGASMARRHARTSCKCKNASASPHSCGAGTGSGTSAVRTASVRSSH